MVTGIVLVNVERAMIRSVIEDLMRIEGVSEVYSVAGEYDLVVMIRVQKQRRTGGNHRYPYDSRY